MTNLLLFVPILLPIVVGLVCYCMKLTGKKLDLVTVIGLLVTSLIAISLALVKDAGEVNNVGKATTRQQFAEWSNKVF